MNTTQEMAAQNAAWILALLLGTIIAVGVISAVLYAWRHKGFLRDHALTFVADRVEGWLQRRLAMKLSRFFTGSPCVPFAQSVGMARVRHGRCQMLTEYEGRAIAGSPVWRLREVLTLTPSKIARCTDLQKWEAMLDNAERQIERARRIVDNRRVQLTLGVSTTDEIPLFLRKQAGY